MYEPFSNERNIKAENRSDGICEEVASSVVYVKK